MSRFALDFVAIEQMWHTHADKLRNGMHKTTYTASMSSTFTGVLPHWNDNTQTQLTRRLCKLSLQA